MGYQLKVGGLLIQQWELSGRGRFLSYDGHEDRGPCCAWAKGMGVIDAAACAFGAIPA